MAYTPLNWQSGDIVTAEKLNQMKGGVLFITPTYTPIDNYIHVSLGYSYRDIMSMIENNVMPIVLYDGEDGISFMFFGGAFVSGDTYVVQFSETYTAYTDTDSLAYDYEDYGPGPELL